MSRKISFGGQTFVVPDDATDDEITQIAGGSKSATPAVAPPPGLPGVPSPAAPDRNPILQAKPLPTNETFGASEEPGFMDILHTAAGRAKQAYNGETPLTGYD